MTGKSTNHADQSAAEAISRQLRELRQRLRLKQVTLAAMLKVSQGYLSRLEAGQVIPNAEVMRRIDRLVETPANRPILDQMVAAVERSPHMVLLHGVPIGRRLYASSEGCLNACGGFAYLQAKSPPYDDRFEQFWNGLRQLVDQGLTSAEIVACGHLWTDDRSGTCYWRSTHVPIHIDLGTCVIHTTNVRVSQDQYDNERSNWGGLFSIERPDWSNPLTYIG